jgi:hypothetical protein
MFFLFLILISTSGFCAQKIDLEIPYLHYLDRDYDENELKYNCSKTESELTEDIRNKLNDLKINDANIVVFSTIKICSKKSRRRLRLSNKISLWM